jgi:hypothetical protein
MIRYLDQENLDRNKWDSCINESINGLEYSKSWYLDIVAPGWKALVKNDYESVFPLNHCKKWGLYYLDQPVFTRQLGVFSRLHLTEDLVSEFIEAIPRKYKFADICLNTFNKISDQYYKVISRMNFELDLINSYDNLWKNYSENLRNDLQKDAKAGITLLKGCKPDDIIKIVSENSGPETNRLTDKDYLKLSKIAYTGIYKGLVTTYCAYNRRNELLAGIILLMSYQKIVFLFSALTLTGRQNNTLAFLIDHLIREHAGQSITLDFDGSLNEYHARLYKSFGSKPCTYPHLELNKLFPSFTLGLKQIKRISK